MVVSTGIRVIEQGSAVGSSILKPISELQRRLTRRSTRTSRVWGLRPARRAAG